MKEFTNRSDTVIIMKGIPENPTSIVDIQNKTDDLIEEKKSPTLVDTSRRENQSISSGIEINQLKSEGYINPCAGKMYRGCTRRYQGRE